MRKQLERAMDEAALAIRGLKSTVAELHGLSEQIALRLDDMETLIRTLSDNLVTGMHGQEERQAIFDRVRRLRELRNMMELGSFMIDVNRKMEAAWERLP